MWPELISRIARDLVAASKRKAATMVVGICGAQGSGKSRITAAIAEHMREGGVNVAVLALDDLYIGHERRALLAVQKHPLLATRGPPGTHDVALGALALARLAKPGRIALPRFNKAQDNFAAQGDWPVVDGPVDVVLFEGWCVGATPQNPAELVAPINELEVKCDSDGSWRRSVNDALAQEYQQLFASLDRLILLAAPDFSVVARWRQEQEHMLRARLLAQGLPLARTMDDAAIERFVQYYERLTRHVLREMPARADLTIRLDAARNILECFGPPSAR
ncbi:kinase [Sphingobium mellinum]|uniref:kinase n=1 Tax=Sphingobium mellinum TaxID=1387166 RepID=UPI0030EF5322